MATGDDKEQGAKAARPPGKTPSKRSRKRTGPRRGPPPPPPTGRGAARRTGAQPLVPDEIEPDLDQSALDLIEPAEPPTPPVVTIEPMGGAAPLAPITIEPRREREGARAVTIDSGDIVAVSETSRYGVKHAEALEGHDSVDVEIDVDTPLQEPPVAGARGSAGGVEVARSSGSSEQALVVAPADDDLVEPMDDLVEPMDEEAILAPKLTADADTVLTSLHAFLEQELDSCDADERRTRAMLLYEMGHLEEVVYRDAEQSLRRYELAFEQDDGFVPVLRALRRRHADAGNWGDYVRVLRAEVQVSRGERERAMLLALLGEALWRRLGDTEGAVENLQSALTLVPRARRALEVLRAIYSETKRWDELLAVLRQMANITTDAAERARLTVEMAEICELRLDAAADAEELYAQALDLDSANEKALLALRRLYFLHRRWQRSSELLAREAGQEYEPSEMYADLYRAARIADTHLHDDARSASLLETVAALRPADPLPLQALTEVYQRTGRSEDLAAALTRQARLARDPAVRADLLYRLGQLYQDWLGRPEKALEIYRNALKEQPNHDATLRAVAQLYRRLECWEDLLDVELLRAERRHETAARADGYLCAARICELQLKDAQRAVGLYERAWRVHRGQLEAFRALDRIYRQTHRWDALAQLCEERAGVTSDTGLAAALLRESARVHEERLDQRDRAISALERLREAQPRDREALMHLARLYELGERADDLRRTLEKWAELSQDEDERAELRRRLAEQLEHALKRPEEAAAIYRDMLAKQPDDEIARERLKAIYERAGRWTDLVDTLKGEVARRSEAQGAVVLLQIGRLCEDKLGETAKAREAYEQALARDQGCAPAAVALEDLLRREQQWEPLVDLIAQQAEATRETPLAAGALCRAGEVCEERLGKQEQALALYGRAIGLDPQCEPARQGLERIYLRLDDVAALESQYLREAEEAANPLLRVRAYLRLAALFDRGSGESDAAAAADAYEATLKVVEDQPDALNGLASLCRRRGEWQRLAELLGRIAASAEDRGAALSALKEWAAILEVHQSEQWDPTPIYERILDGDPQDPHAVAALERLAYQLADGDALIRLAVIQMETASDESWVAALCMRAALISVAASRSVEAVELLRRGLAGFPRYLPAIRLVRRLQEQLKNYGEVATLLLQEAEIVSSDSAKHAALHRAAGIMLDQLEDVEGAKQSLEQVFNADPRHEGAFQKLAGILRDREDWKPLVDIYRRRLAVIGQEQSAGLLLELATIYHENLADQSAAIQVLAELLAAEPESGAALDRIAQLCIDQGRWREAEEYLGRLTAVVHEDPDRRRQAFFRRVDLLSEQLGEEDRALETLQELLLRERGDREALERVVRICRRRGDWDRTVQALEELARAGSPEKRASSLVELAEICSRSLNDPQRASSALRDAAHLCLEGTQALGRVASFFERRGDFDAYAQLLAAVLERLPPEGAPGAVAMRLARSRLLAGRLLRPEEAEREVRQALRAEPNSLEARLELAGLHLWGDRLDEAALEYRRVLELDSMSVPAYRGLYRVNERRGDAQQAGGAAQVVCALSQPSEAEQAAAGQLTLEMGEAIGSTTAALEVQSYWNLLAEGEVPRAALTLLHGIADYLPQIGFAELVEQSDVPLMPPDEHNPLTARCIQVARLLGAETFECYVAQGLSTLAEVRLAPRLCVVFADEFATKAPAAQLRFVVGRAAGEIVSKSAYLRLSPARSLECALAAAVEPFERGFGGYLGADSELEAMVRQLARVIPRKVRRTLEQPARAYVAEGAIDVRKAQSIGNRAAARAGLLFAGDVGAVLAVLERERTDRRVKADLLRFSVSQQLHEARRRIGLYGK